MTTYFRLSRNTVVEPGESVYVRAGKTVGGEPLYSKGDVFGKTVSRVVLVRFGLVLEMYPVSDLYVLVTDEAKRPHRRTVNSVEESDVKEMTVFVYYNDGNCCNGDYGLELCGNDKSAEAFITKRMAEAANPSIKNYMVIKGNTCLVKEVCVVKEVKIG